MPPKEPTTNLVFEAVLLRLRDIKAGEIYFCSPTVYSRKVLIESHQCPAIVVYQAGDEWKTGGGANPSSEACGAALISVAQQMIICLFHDSPQTVNRLKADVEIALRGNESKSGNLIAPTATDPGVTYKLQGPSMSVAGEGLELGDARFILTAIYSRNHGTP
jgi:hypothetical protein